MWVARDKDGYLTLFITVKPVRVEDKRWSGNKHTSFTAFEDWAALPEEWFPNLKWEDEPLEIELVSKNDNAIVPKMLNAVQEKLAESVEDYFNYVGHIQDIHPYSKEQEQNYYNDMCWRSQDWEAIKYDHPSTWDLNFDDYVGSKK